MKNDPPTVCLNDRRVRLAAVLLGFSLVCAGPVAAQTGTLFVEGDRVGVGTATPNSSLQIKQAGATLDIEDANASEAARILLRLTNRGRINFNLFNSQTNENWQFSNTLVGFQINQTTSPGVEFRLDNNGDLFLEGQVFASSSAELKEEFHRIDSLGMLERVRNLPISTWQYKGRAGTRHIGPTAEDFYSAFVLGLDDRTLSPSDTSGVALAAIQGLGVLLEEKDREIESLRDRLEEEAARTQELDQRLSDLEGKLQGLAGGDR